MVNVVEYSEMNSGGYLLMQAKDYEKLEDAGWKVVWTREKDLLYGMAFSAELRGYSLEEAMQNWEKATGRWIDADPWCKCCGPRHNFSEYDKEIIRGR